MKCPECVAAGSRSTVTEHGGRVVTVRKKPPRTKYDSEHIKEWAKEHGIALDGFQVADLLYRLGT